MGDIQKRTNSSNIDGIIRGPRKPVSYIRPEASSKPIEAAQPQSQISTNLPSYYQPPNLNTQQNIKPRFKTKHSRRKKILISSLLIIMVGFSIGIYFGANILSSLNKTLHGNVFSDVNALFSNQPLKGESQGRVNILLAGDSADDPGHAGADLTDSIMLVSIDTKNHTGFMLSIPRDLWVSIPGDGDQKINAANSITNFSENGYPSGGMGQLQEIVSNDLGIPVDYYALLNYSAFKNAVNTVGGITVDINSPDPRGIYDAFTNLKLPNGEDPLTGQQALDLARARGDDVAGDISYGFTNSDFDRTQHQREMLVALSQKAKTVGVLTNPLKITDLFKSFSQNIHTDMNVQNVLRLVQVTKGMNMSNLHSLTYSYGTSNSLLSDYTSPDGQEALIPSEGVDNFGQLQQYYQQLTSNNPVVREAPSIVVLNGTNTTGLAHTLSTTLKADGFNVEAAEDANNTYNSSLIVDLTNGKKPASLQMLKTLMPINTPVATNTSATLEAAEASGYKADFVIVLGQNSDNIKQP